MFQSSAADYVKYTNNKSWSEKKYPRSNFKYVKGKTTRDCSAKELYCMCQHAVVSLEYPFQFPCRKGHVV